MLQILESKLNGMIYTGTCIVVGVTDIIKDIRIGLVNSTTNPMVQYPIPVAKPIQKGVEYQLQMEILILFVVEYCWLIFRSKYSIITKQGFHEQFHC